MPANLKEARKRGLSGASIEGIGGLFECLAVEQALDVARDGVRGHDKRRVERMDVFACDRAFRMADQRCDRRFGKSEIVRNARETVTQDMGLMPASGESLKICSQWFGKLPKGLSSSWPGKT